MPKKRSRAIPRWTNEEVKKAAGQGWGIFVDSDKLKIQRLDESRRFVGDDHATEHVLSNAKTCPMCRDAIRIVYGI
jgi:hypothetical protein